MSERATVWMSTRKNFINIFFFLLSIIIIVAIWPSDKTDTFAELIGSVIVVSSFYLVLYLFLLHFRSEILDVTRKTFFIIITILSFVVLSSITLSISDQKFLYIIPFAIIPIIICTFYDARLALFIHLITLMLVGFIIPEPFDFVFISFISGVVAIFALTNIYRDAKILFSATLVVVSYSVIYFAKTLMYGDNIGSINWYDYELFAINGVLVLLCYPLIFLFEKKFYFLSDATLLELSDINQPLLRKLAEEAPGSFQHSLQVANLAEEAARVVGANLLLARTGSLYHDVGKILSPSYFIENQSYDVNPHDDLDPLDSAKIIIGHVNEGAIFGRKFKLPVQIIDFIRTHHGTTKVYYFYKKYLEKGQKASVEEKYFIYPGPKPFSKELAIVMMADAVEASSRTLDKYSSESISELVERIIIIQEQEDQFSDSPLTFRDISDIKRIFKKRLLNIYHTRVVYPE